MNEAGESVLDARGMLCPQPIIDLTRRIAGIDEGCELTVLCDDLAFPLDLRAWCAGTGHELLELVTEGRVHRARIRKSPRD